MSTVAAPTMRADYERIAAKFEVEAIPLTREDVARLLALARAQVEAPALRDDVWQFAGQMSAAMDSKQVERESRNDPHYMSEDYPLNQALACAADKAVQLEHWAVRADGNPANDRCRDRAIKTAVHLANFCMIVAAKLKASQPKANS